MKLYAIKDNCAGTFERPFVSYNDACASRDFITLKQSPTHAAILGDLDLYYLGEVDEETGAITGDVRLITEGKAVAHE